MFVGGFQKDKGRAPAATVPEPSGRFRLGMNGQFSALQHLAAVLDVETLRRFMVQAAALKVK